MNLSVLRKILPTILFVLLVLFIQPNLLTIKIFEFERPNYLIASFLLVASGMGVLSTYYKLQSVDAFILDGKINGKVKNPPEELVFNFTKFMHGIFLMIPALFSVMLFVRGDVDNVFFIWGLILVVCMFLADSMVCFNYGEGITEQFHSFWRNLMGDAMATVYVFTVHTLIFGQITAMKITFKDWGFVLDWLIIALFWGVIMWCVRLPIFIEEYVASDNVKHPANLAIRETMIFFAISLLLPLIRTFFT